MKMLIEWHSQDLRIKEITDGICPTISAGMGMGGVNNTTSILIVEDEDTNREEILRMVRGRQERDPQK